MGSPRCGTHFLGALLHSNRIHQVGEIFSGLDKIDHPISCYKDKVRDTIESQSSKEGFSVQFFRNALHNIARNTGIKKDRFTLSLLLHYLFEDFKFINIFRQNIIAELVSHWVAKQNHHWHDTTWESPAEEKDLVTPNMLLPDRHLKIEEWHNPNFRDYWFDLLPMIPHVQIQYEELCQRTESSMNKISDHIQFPMKSTEQYRFLKRKMQIKEDMVREVVGHRINSFLETCNLPAEESEKWTQKGLGLIGMLDEFETLD